MDIRKDRVGADHEVDPMKTQRRRRLLGRWRYEGQRTVRRHAAETDHEIAKRPSSEKRRSKPGNRKTKRREMSVSSVCFDNGRKPKGNEFNLVAHGGSSVVFTFIDSELSLE